MKCQKVDICKPLCVVVTATCFSAYLCADFRGPELHHQGRKLNMYLGNFWFQVVVSSIFYFLPLRLPLQLALAFENGWQKKHTTYPPYKHSIEKKGGVDFYSQKKSLEVRKWNDPTNHRSTDVAGWGFWSSVDRLRRRRFWRKAFKPMAVPFWHVPLPRVKRRSCCCWNTGVLVKGGEGEVLCCVFGFGGKWLMIGKDRVNDFEVNFGPWCSPKELESLISCL